MRCPDCNKMVSYDEPIAEVQSEDVSEEGQVSLEVRLALPCSECNTELKETTFSFEHYLDHTCSEEKIICGCGHPASEHTQEEGIGPGKCTHSIETIPSQDQEVPGNKEIKPPCNCTRFGEPLENKGFELEVDDPETSDDYRPKINDKGKPVQMRYQKHFFGVNITGRATCNKCGEEIEFELSDDIQSSAMDEC